MAYGSVNVDKMVTSDGISSSGVYGFKNRIINGAMVLNQRGFSGTPASLEYTLDRWRTLMSTVSSKFTVSQNAGSVTPPAGFINYLGVTSSSAYSVGSGDQYGIQQWIEGYNIADLAWGTASAQTVTLSFWVRSSLTGTFGGSLGNSGGSRSYPFTYTINSANTWEYETITIAGDTSGTWLTDNSRGLNVTFGLGVGSTLSGTAGAWAGTDYRSATGATSVVGTNGATFYVTGVMLEKGSTATSFDYRPYGTELQLCQRYYEKTYSQGTAVGTADYTSTTIDGTTANGSGDVQYGIKYKVVKRAAPTLTGYLASTGASGSWEYGRSGVSGTASVSFNIIGDAQARAVINTGGSWIPVTITGHWTASSEL
jgi:hypothetical protein